MNKEIFYETGCNKIPYVHIQYYYYFIYKKID